MQPGKEVNTYRHSKNRQSQIGEHTNVDPIALRNLDRLERPQDASVLDCGKKCHDGPE